MANVYPTVKIYLDENNDDIAETDISAYVISSISGQHGLTTQKETDRIPSPGSVSFSVMNYALARTGAYYAGKAVSVTLTYGGREKQFFYGHVSPVVDEDSGFIRPLPIRLTVNGWLHVASNTRLTGLALTTNKRADEALTSLMATLTNPPSRTDFDTGNEVFVNMFDGSGAKAKIYSELDKITKSELGYLYELYRIDGTGEVLKLEGMYSRGSFRPYSRIPTSATTRGLLKFHGNAAATGYLKFHGNAGASGKIKIDEATEASFAATHRSADWVSGKSVVNDFSVTNIFRRNDVSNVVLYKITYPIQIGVVRGRGGYTIEGSYTDPNGGTPITVFDQVVDTSDWDFNSQPDGSGADRSANLTVTTEFYSNRFVAHFDNIGQPSYLTLFQVRGKGIYKYSPAEILLTNDESKQKMRTEIGDNLTREYSNDIVTSRMFALRALALNRLPRQELLSASYDGNFSENNLMGFMYLEQGDKVAISNNFPDHAGDFYIQGVKFNITTGGLVNYTWFLKEEIKTTCTPVAISAPSAGVGNRMAAVDYDILPHLSNMQGYSYSAWVRRNAASAFGAIIDRTVDEGAGRRGNWLILSNRTLIFDSYKTPTDGSWEATNAMPNNLLWHHVCLTYDNTSDTADPIIYVDGSTVIVTETLTPSGQTDDDSDVATKMFNVAPDPALTDEYFYDTIESFTLKDVRIYNRILTPTEIGTIEAAEDDYTTVPDGLAFQGFYVPITQRADYEGDTIENDDLVLEAVHGCGGTPYNDDDSSDTLMLTGEAI